MDTKLRETLKILVTNVKTFMSGNYLAKNTTKTSDLINDGEGGSPVDKFVTESAIVQSDWEEGDSLNNGFIKNRTHYKTIYDIFTTFNSLTMISDGSKASASITLPELPEGMSWSDEKNWLITFIMDGEEYEYKSYDFDAGSGYAVLIFGFESEMGTKPTVVLDLRNSGLSLMDYTVDVTITDVKIIYLTSVKQLPDYYIPISIARIIDVPNNGNIVNTILTQTGNGVRMKSAVSEDANYTLGMDAMAIGMHTTAAGDCQFTFGKNNVLDTNNTYIEIVGNGTNTSNLSNARTLDWDGNEVLAGDLSIGKTLGNGTLMVEGGYGNSSLSLISHAGSNQGAQGTLNIVSEKRGIMNIAALSAIGSCGVINISTFTQSLSDMTQMSGSNGGINIYTEKLNLFNQNSSYQGLFINTIGHLQSSGNSFTIENTGEGQTGTNLYLIAQPGEGATGPGQAYLQGKGNPNSGAGGYVYVEATGSGSGGGGYLYLTASGSQDTASSGSGGTVYITANGAGNAGGGTINISAYAGQNGTGRSAGAINISAQSGTSDSSISIAADTITLNGAVKQLKKAISPYFCTPDTYYCPTSAITALVCDDTGFTGDYNYTFSGCFTADTGMTQMPTQTDYQSITMTWYGDIGIEAGERYMFCSTKVSATEYVGVVTKLV